jgi:sugar phosphate isomerase/epimerase
MPNGITRRAFAGLAGAAAFRAAPARAARQVPIALQLYSLRKECEADLPGTLAAVAKMGFQGVEWFGWGGYFQRGAKELRRMLDGLGLRTASDHVHLPSLLGDRFEASVEFHRTLGNTLVTLSELLGKREAKATAAFWEDGARRMNEMAEKLKPHGIRLGLHNHTVEFVKTDDGRLPWDIVFGNTVPEVAQQLDLGSALRAGADPASYIRKYPGRTLTLHMKDWAPDRKDLLIGEGSVRWHEIIGLAETAGGVEWYIVEQESYPYPPLESVARSLANLRRLLAGPKD